MPTLDQYQRKVRDLIKQQDRMTDAEVKRMLRLLRDTRRSTLESLLKLANSKDSFQYYQLQSLRDAIDAQADYLIRQYKPIMGGAMEKAWEYGGDMPVEALKSVGVDVSLRQLSRTQLQVAQEIAGDLVTKVGDSFRTEAKSIITRGMMGQESPHKVLKQIAKLLATEPDRQTKALGSIAYQAERIQRTEMNGIASVANRMRVEEIAADDSDMLHYWDSVSDGRTRPAHADAGARYAPGSDPGPIPVKDDFIVGGEKAKYPHDPRLSAKNRILCRCVEVLYKAEWFEE